MTDISGVADLAQLAVTDNINTRFRLPCDDFVHGAGDNSSEFMFVVQGAVFLGEHAVCYCLASRETAHVGGEKVLLAGLHEGIST